MGHLTGVQRYTIQALREQNLTIKFIADCLGRDKSGISIHLFYSVQSPLRHEDVSGTLCVPPHSATYTLPTMHQPEHIRF
jgi:hypothetical protein